VDLRLAEHNNPAAVARLQPRRYLILAAESRILLVALHPAQAEAIDPAFAAKTLQNEGPVLAQGLSAGGPKDTLPERYEAYQ